MTYTEVVIRKVLSTKAPHELIDGVLEYYQPWYSRGVDFSDARRQLEGGLSTIDTLIDTLVWYRVTEAVRDMDREVDLAAKYEAFSKREYPWVAVLDVKYQLSCFLSTCFFEKLASYCKKRLETKAYSPMYGFCACGGHWARFSCDKCQQQLTCACGGTYTSSASNFHWYEIPSFISCTLCGLRLFTNTEQIASRSICIVAQQPAKEPFGYEHFCALRSRPGEGSVSMLSALKRRSARVDFTLSGTEGLQVRVTCTRMMCNYTQEDILEELLASREL
eukprot:TRINITY_DN42207_c0_g1_i1.p1 TRINITY_DN42207_c0_g1~~TRINITY_DN42207_c0_g1_i1.p1  ORF type:complete len:277 (+),score=48.92 TRINITY_DN42207_c0_g1_i1:332-1162(+)